MSVTRGIRRPAHPRIIHRLLPVLLAVALALGPASAPEAVAQTPSWEPTGLAEATSQLFTPTSGAFFARTAGGLVRSDDGGASWAEVGLQDRGKISDLALGIDGANLYAATEQGVFRLPLGAI